MGGYTTAPLGFLVYRQLLLQNPSPFGCGEPWRFRHAFQLRPHFPLQQPFRYPQQTRANQSGAADGGAFRPGLCAGLPQPLAVAATEFRHPGLRAGRRHVAANTPASG